MKRMLFVLLLALSGCPGFGSEELGSTGEVPENPTWEDVLVVYDRICNECHSVPATQGAPGNFRLDTCEETDGIQGSKSRADRNILRQITLADSSPMPPANYINQPTPDDDLLLQRFFDNGWPCTGTGQ